MRTSLTQRSGASRPLVVLCGLILLFQLLLPARLAWAQAGVCRNASSGPNCTECTIWDLEDCSDSTKTIIAAVCLTLIAAAFAIVLFPEILAAAGIGGLLVEAGEGGAVGAELVTEEAAALEETAALEAEEAAAAEATEEATVASEEATEEATVTSGEATETAAAEAAEASEAEATASEAAEEPTVESEADSTPLSAEQVIAEAQEAQLPGLSEVNPDNFRTNCWMCARNGDAVLGGEPAVAAGDLGPMSPAANEQYFGGQFADTTPGDLENQLLSEGDGARGIVRINTDGSSVGHQFNVQNNGGQVRYIDFQTKTIYTSFQNALTNMRGSTTLNVLQFLPTNF